MENKELKQTAIEAAYGEYWNDVKDFVDENGWCTACHSVRREINKDFTELKSWEKWQPESLKGIETNNGWIRIESKEDLPTPKGKEDVWVLNELGEIHAANTCLLSDSRIKEYWINTITHYQSITKPKLPIY